MKQLRKYLCLPATERRLLVQSVWLLGMVRLGLWLLPFQTVRRLLIHMTCATSTWHEAEHIPVERIAWAVAVTSQYVPMATCLTQALATQVLLGRQGYVARLCIGVARSATGQFQAHAWVEYQGRIVIGGTDAPMYFTPLPPLEGKNL